MIYEEGSRITDGYFVYSVIYDAGDGWLTVRLCGHVLRIQKAGTVLN